jgi:hypothetical protein
MLQNTHGNSLVLMSVGTRNDSQIMKQFKGDFKINIIKHNKNSEGENSRLGVVTIGSGGSRMKSSRPA